VPKQSRGEWFGKWVPPLLKPFNGTPFEEEPGCCSTEEERNLGISENIADA